MLLGLCGSLSWLSRWFVYGEGHRDRPIVALVGLLVAAFLVYAVAVARVIRHPERVRLASVLVWAVLCRLVLLSSSPIQEDDLYRYVWDGQVVRHGVSPYRYAPAEVAAFAPGAERGETRAQRERATLSRLATGSGRLIVERINHPEVPTIYPPLAQAVFAATQGIAPWSLRGMRTILLLFDGLCVLLIVALLRRLALPTARVLIYAWSPLVLKEFANSGHMDVVAMAAVLASLLLLVQRRWIWASVMLALGVAGKYFPLVLVPVVGARLWREGRRIAPAGAVAWLMTLGVCTAPFLGDGIRMFRGLRVYATSWELNAGSFALLEMITRWAMPASAAAAARVLAAGLIVAVIVWGVRRQPDRRDPMAMAGACLVSLGALFLLSPVQDPWYLAWLVPLLCVHPWRPWLLLTGLIHLYYLGFFIEYHLQTPESAAFWWGLLRIVEYVPFYGLLAWETWRRRSRPAASSAVPGSVVASGSSSGWVPATRWAVAEARPR